MQYLYQGSDPVRDYSNTVLRTLNSILKNFLKKMDAVLKDIPEETTSKIITLTYYDYVLIAKDVFKSIFDNYYGNKYDVEALMNSLSFGGSNTIAPTIYYDVKKFRFLGEKDRHKKFNENNYLEDSWQYFRDEDLYDEAYKNDFFEDSDISNLTEYEIEENEDMMKHKSIDYWNFKLANQNILIDDLRNVELVYKIAELRAYQEFDKLFDLMINPVIIKKYNKKK